MCPCRPKRLCQPDGSEVVVGCTENCLNRLSYIHCDPRTCPCGLACTNKPFHQLKAPALEVFLTENRGHGVRMTQPLDKGQFVVEYAGEVSCRCGGQELSWDCYVRMVSRGWVDDSCRRAADKACGCIGVLAALGASSTCMPHVQPCPHAPACLRKVYMSQSTWTLNRLRIGTRVCR